MDHAVLIPVELLMDILLDNPVVPILIAFVIVSVTTEFVPTRLMLV